MRLAGRTALVTGAGGPMGRAVAGRFAAEGAALALTDISGTRLAAAAEALRPRLAPGAALFAHRADVTAEGEVEGLLDGVAGALPPVDLLVNVVGGIRGGLEEPFETLAETRWEDTFRLNLKGTRLLTRALAPLMRRRGYGRIVNIASVDLAGAPGRADYGAAKAAVASLTRTLAAELAPQVLVNCIAPGVIRTTAVERLPAHLVEHFRERSLLGRLGEPQEIAGAALFLCSEDASYITGETLAVSGGIPARL